MDRRAFLKEVALWSAGLTLVPPLVKVTPEARAEGKQSLVVVGEGSDYPALVSKVLAPLGGMTALVKKGDRVVVKPNIGWDRTPEQGANTHPEVVKSLVKQALEAGAGQVLVFDRTCNEERRCYVNSGIKKAVESLGTAGCPVLLSMSENLYRSDWPKANPSRNGNFIKTRLRPTATSMCRWPSIIPRPVSAWV